MSVQFPRILSKLDEPWAIEPAKLDLIVQAVVPLLSMSRDERAGAIAMLRLDFEAIEGDAAAAEPPAFTRRGGIAVVPLSGTLMSRTGGMDAVSGGRSLAEFRQDLQSAANDSEIGQIVIDVDSPGGSVDMVPETAAFVRELNKAIPITAVANTTAASAAFWIAAQAGELVVTPSGSVGSVGIVARHEDRSAALENEGVRPTLLTTAKFKTEGANIAPLSEEAADYRLAQMREFHAQFEADLSRGRSMPIASVRRDFGEGRMILANEAVSRGMADRVQTMDDVLRRLGARGRGRPRNRTAEASALDELLELERV